MGMEAITIKLFWTLYILYYCAPLIAAPVTGIICGRFMQRLSTWQGLSVGIGIGLAGVASSVWFVAWITDLRDAPNWAYCLVGWEPWAMAVIAPAATCFICWFWNGSKQTQYSPPAD